MKKIIVCIALLLTSVFAVCQKSYYAYKTEMYELDGNDNYRLIKTIENVDIPIYLLKRFIHIEAQQHAYFILQVDKVQKLQTDKVKGDRYPAYDITLQEDCYVDVIDVRLSATESVSIISLLFQQGKTNIRYYVSSR